MAVTTQKSDIYTNQTASGAQTFNRPDQVHGRVRFAEFDYAQSGAGDAGSIAQLFKLPGGSVRLILPLCRIAHSALGASRTIDLGWEAYTDPDGAAVAADPNGLDDGVDGSSAGSYNPTGTVGGAETYRFNSRDGVVITAQVNDGTFQDGATLKGYLAYVVD